MNEALRGIGGPKRSCLAICLAVAAGVSPVVSGQSPVAVTGSDPFPKLKGLGYDARVLATVLSRSGRNCAGG